METNTACGALSFLTPIGYQSGDCGYCKSEETSQRTPNSRASYYARSKSLCPQHYQELMDRGWRRSGSLLYIPDASRSCCPHYTIRLASSNQSDLQVSSPLTDERLPVSDFKPSRDQRQALNRWNRYVLGEKYSKEVNAKYPLTKEEKKKANNTFNLPAAIHESEQSTLKSDVHPSDHRFEVTLERDNFTEEKYALFSDYQRHVHHETDSDISRAGFQRFLCSSPLHRHAEPNGKKLGSYHQCYRLDGRLVAMGVLDLLPHAVSGVYFLYHRDVENWSFGKLSALREATLALEGGYEYYYMGYYIHACKKMRYKGDYRPQYVLDYNSGEWDIMDDEMRDLMDRRQYASMSKERARKTAENGKGGDDVVLHPKPLEAMNSGLSLLELHMPGVMTLDAVQQTVDLDSMKVFLGRSGIHEMQNILSWDSGSETKSTTIKGIVAEFAAAVGPTIAEEITLDFTQ